MTISNQSVPDSLTIINYVNATLVHDIPAGVDALKAKKKQFVDVGLTDVVISSLGLLKYDHGSFSAVLSSKAAPETQEYAAYVVKVIDDAIVSGIQDFET